MLSFKEGVKITGVRSEIVLAIQVAYSVYMEYEEECVITSVVEGKHSRGSLHYSGAAFDIRTRTILKDFDKEAIKEDIRYALTDEFDVVLEATHIHVEFQPKSGYP